MNLKKFKFSSNEVDNGLEAAGSNHSYQLLIIFIFLFLKVVTDSFFCPLPYFLMNPNITCFTMNLDDSKIIGKFNCNLNKVCLINHIYDSIHNINDIDDKQHGYKKPQLNEFKFLNFILDKNKLKNTFINSFDIYCNSIKIGLIGSSASIGNLIANIISPFFTDYLGRIKTIKLVLLFDILIKILLFYIKDFTNLILILTLVNITNNIIYFAACLYINEMVSSSHRGVYSCYFNSFFGISGILFTLIFYLTEEWRYLNLLSVSCAFISFVLISIFLNESVRFYSIKLDNYLIFDTLELISKFNKREKEFMTWKNNFCEFFQLDESNFLNNKTNSCKFNQLPVDKKDPRYIDQKNYYFNPKQKINYKQMNLRKIKSFANNEDYYNNLIMDFSFEYNQVKNKTSNKFDDFYIVQHNSNIDSFIYDFKEELYDDKNNIENITIKKFRNAKECNYGTFDNNDNTDEIKLHSCKKDKNLNKDSFQRKKFTLFEKSYFDNNGEKYSKMSFIPLDNLIESRSLMSLDNFKEEKLASTRDKPYYSSDMFYNEVKHSNKNGKMNHFNQSIFMQVKLIFTNKNQFMSFAIFSYISFVTISGIMFNAIDMKESLDSMYYPLILFLTEFLIISSIGYLIELPSFGRKIPCIFFSLLAGVFYLLKYFMESDLRLNISNYSMEKIENVKPFNLNKSNLTNFNNPNTIIINNEKKHNLKSYENMINNNSIIIYNNREFDNLSVLNANKTFKIDFIKSENPYLNDLEKSNNYQDFTKFNQSSPMFYKYLEYYIEKEKQNQKNLKGKPLSMEQINSFNKIQSNIINNDIDRNLLYGKENIRIGDMDDRNKTLDKKVFDVSFVILMINYFVRFTVSISFNILIEYNFEIYSTDIRSFAFSLNKLFSRFGDFFTPLLMSYNYNITSFILGILYITMGILIPLLRETRGEILTDVANESNNHK